MYARIRHLAAVGSLWHFTLHVPGKGDSELQNSGPDVCFCTPALGYDWQPWQPWS